MFRDSKDNKPANTEVNLELRSAIISRNSKNAVTALNKGADVDTLINAPLISLASFANNKELAELLIMRGASLETKDSDGNTPLFWAKGECLKLLLEQKADVNAIKNNGDTLLLEAARKLDAAKVKLLLEHQADVNIKGRDGRSVRDLANTIISDLINIKPKGPSSGS